MRLNCRGFCGIGISIITCFFGLASPIRAAPPPYKSTIHYQPTGHYAGMGMGVRMDIDGSGNMYTIEVYSTVVNKFGSNGEFLSQFGTPGTGNGQFSSTRDVAVDSSGNVYVADTNRIQKFDPNGNYLGQWPAPGISTLTIDGSDALFANLGSNVYKYDTNGAQTGFFAAITGRDISVSPTNGHILLSRNIRPGNAIYEYDTDGTFLGSRLAMADAPGQVGSPWGITHDSSGNLYLIDYLANEVKVFDSGFNFQTAWANIDASNIASSPADVVYVSGHITVDGSYLTNSFIYSYNTSGTRQDQWLSYGSGDGELYVPGGVALDSVGNVYVLDVNNTRVMKYNNAGIYQDKWSVAGILTNGGDPLYGQGIAISGNDEVYVSTQADAQVKKYDSDGNLLFAIDDFSGSGSSDGSFGAPGRLLVDSNQNLYVADSYNCMVYVFNSAGVWQREWMPDSGCPIAMAVNSTNGLHILTDGWGIDLYSLQGVYQNQFWYSYEYPTDMAIDTNDNLYIADFLDNIVYKYNSSGTMTDSWGGLSQQTSGFHYPYGIYVDIVDNVYVADAINSRVVVFGDTEFPASSPTPTPTPPPAGGSTPQPAVLGTSVSANSLSAGTPPGCSLPVPDGVPDLFQIDQIGETATLYFTPVKTNTTQYVIAYGDDVFAQDYGVQFNPTQSAGVVRFQIGELRSNTPYWFRVRAGNGCAVGNWSNTRLSPPSASVYTATLPENSEAVGLIASPLPLLTTTPTPSTSPMPNVSYLGPAGPDQGPRQMPTINAGGLIAGTRNTAVIFLIAELVAVVVSTVIDGLRLFASAVRLANSVGGRAALALIAFPALSQFTYERLSNLLRPVFHLLHLPPLWRERSFGIVFDAVTHQPVARALVAFMPKNGNVRTTMSNQAGRYNATLEPESYRIKAEREAYRFPSKIFTTKESVLFSRVYTPDQTIEVTETMPVTNIAIPLDPIKVSALKYHLRRLEAKLQSLWVQSSLFVLLAGQALSAYIYIIEPTALNLLILVLLTASFIWKGLLIVYEEKFYGLVTDVTGRPLGYTDVDVYRKYQDRYEIYASVMTNKHGRYLLTPENGEYVLKVTDDQHRPVKEVTVTVTDQKPVVSVNISLDIVQQSGTGLT